MSDGYIGFMCGIMVGIALGIMILSVIIVMKDAEERKNNGNQKSNRDFDM